MKAQSTIRRNLRELRRLVEQSKCPVEQRTAQAMEHALRWATLETVGWPSLHNEAIEFSKLIKQEINHTPL